ncbi:hypothetical protein Ahy_A05g022745 [Arachis hypogaea]|uniref:DUF7792 domain-containing protein n=1 Tax=Arachis hypogaea TaxID=3818 RepID=A0A445D1E8_ARAHY|nr:hypothetical protein Ahy_A05g022745 [Arachis hypogaea]
MGENEAAHVAAVRSRKSRRRHHHKWCRRCGRTQPPPSQAPSPPLEVGCRAGVAGKCRCLAVAELLAAGNGAVAAGTLCCRGAAEAAASSDFAILVQMKRKRTDEGKKGKGNHVRGREEEKGGGEGKKKEKKGRRGKGEWRRRGLEPPSGIRIRRRESRLRQTQLLYDNLYSVIRVATAQPLNERRIIVEVTLNHTLALLCCCCRNGGVLRQVFSITTTGDFCKFWNLLESSNGDLHALKKKKNKRCCCDEEEE